MLSLHAADRMLQTADHQGIIDRLHQGGLPLSLPLRARLAHATPATALAMRRLRELVLNEPPALRLAAATLLMLQRPDGGFDGSCEADPLATGCAAAALGGSGPGAAKPDAQLERASEAALAALARMQSGDGLFDGRDDRTLEDRVTVGVMIAHLLGRCESFHRVCRSADLVAALRRHEPRMDPQTRRLWLLAEADKPQTLAIAA
jgi:hypothetical protein